jgi:hypothetical protein
MSPAPNLVGMPKSGAYEIELGGDERAELEHRAACYPRRFRPEQVAEVKAIACELPATHGLPLGRFTRSELHRLVVERGVTDASASTIWRWLHGDALKPWQQRSWIFVRDPAFRERAGRVLDLYQRRFGEHYRQIARPFDWTFTRTDLERVLAKITEREPRLALAA